LLRDVVEQAGRDVTRFVMLTRKNDAPLDFDFAKVLEQSKENPVFYVQYAYARISSVLAKGALAGIEIDHANLARADFSEITHPSEMALVRKLGEWPRLLELAAKHHEPHRIAFYLFELASEFHALWNKGNELPELRFLQESLLQRSAGKMALISAVSIVLSAGLGILGVTPMKEMR